MNLGGITELPTVPILVLLRLPLGGSQLTELHGILGIRVRS